MTDTETEREAPKRLRAADVIDQLQHTIDQLTTRSAEPYVSVEFTRNAKGETQISTKVSAPGGTDQISLEELARETMLTAQALYDDSCAAYPTASGFVRNDGKDGK